MMSCFGGLLKEYKYLSIDRFDGINLSSFAYFLSHCHSDHMVGLDLPKFADRLQSQKNIFLYCSEVSRALLIADDRYCHLADKIITLPIECSQVIDIKINEDRIKSISVTLLPASHCPGSVMFMFEGDEGNVLYTGDFRLPKGSGKRMKCLHSMAGTRKCITSMYVDTTFCIPDAVFIPSREDCLKRLELVVTEWLKKDKSHAVRMNISAKYGYEYIFHALHKKFKTKIYCRRKNLYQCLPDTYKILTDNPENAQIYACFKKEKINAPNQWNIRNADDENLEEKTRKKFLRLTLSTLYFTYAAQPHEVCQQIGKNHYRFCFSFHSSYSEVCDFVKYITPGNVYANVLPRRGMALEEVEEKLATDCLLKSKDENQLITLKRSKTPVITADLFTRKQKTTTSRKRTLSLSSSTDDEDSQHLWKIFSEKYSKKGANKIVNVENTENNFDKKENDAFTSNDQFNISCSPENNRAPLSREVDDLHLQIALNNGLPP